MNNMKFNFAATVLVIVLILVGCSPAPIAIPESPPKPPTTTPTTPPEPTKPTIPPTTPTPAAPPPPLPAIVQGPNEIWAVGRDFIPGVLTVPVGTTVAWTNKSPDEHTIISDNNLFKGSIGPLGGNFSYTFSAVGTFTFNCDLHPGMAGSVIVK